jgi:peptidylprolyl isomerase
MDDDCDDETIMSTGDDHGAEAGDAADAGGDPGDHEDADYVLAQIARDTATTKTLVAVLLVVVIGAVVILGFLVRQNNNTKTVAGSATTSTIPTSTAAAVPSVAGEPCVATSDPLPAGAPAVDVQVGPPPTALVTKDLKVGTGPAVVPTDSVTVNYIGVACSTGKIFDSSYKTGTPIPIPLDVAGLIPGFSTGITGMQVGGQRLIGIPSALAYGAHPRGAAMAPDESLWFVVDLVSITPAK